LHETAHPPGPNMTTGSFRRGSSVERSDLINDAIAGISVLSRGAIAQGTIGTCRILGLGFPDDRKTQIAVQMCSSLGGSGGECPLLPLSTVSIAGDLQTAATSSVDERSCNDGRLRTNSSANLGFLSLR
jgi:hypothetical protein